MVSYRDLHSVFGIESGYSKPTVWSFLGFASLLRICWPPLGHSIGGFGIMPVTVVFTASDLIMVIVSLMAKPTEVNILRESFAAPS